MNIFEKLIDELKEENLLEETVIETSERIQTENQATLLLDSFDKKILSKDKNTSEVLKETFNNSDETGFEFKPSTSNENVSVDTDKLKGNVEETVEKIPDSVEFFYRRAKEEVASLQMVEHILSGAERDQMKIVPKTFDDLAVKTALHKFAMAAEENDSTEHSQTEFQLMQETENWYSALSQRDKNISVGHLRRFFENTRPALSSQALLSLARFYRNAPYSESVRSKFDLVITRLLTREIKDDKRELVFSRDEVIKHLEGLYAEWSSISLYSPDKDDSTILIAALKFEDFMSEAKEATKFDSLLKKDFFNRLRAVKESTSENFFAPVIATAAIECNVQIGNRYVDLLRAEEVNPEILIKKYGVLREEAISDITGKTLQLAQLLSNKEESDKNDKEIEEKEDLFFKENSEEQKTKVIKSKKEKGKKSGLFGINRWLLAAALIVIVGNAALFLFSGETVSGVQTSAIVADKVDLENSVLKEHLKSARMSNGIFFGKIAPSWNSLNLQEKEHFLQKIIAVGKEKGYNTAHLLDDENRPIAYASESVVKVNDLSPDQ